MPSGISRSIGSAADREIVIAAAAPGLDEAGMAPACGSLRG